MSKSSKTLTINPGARRGKDTAHSPGWEQAPTGTRINAHGRRCDLNVPPELLSTHAGTWTLEQWKEHDASR